MAGQRIAICVLLTELQLGCRDAAVKLDADIVCGQRRSALFWLILIHPGSAFLGDVISSRNSLRNFNGNSEMEAPEQHRKGVSTKKGRGPACG